MKRRIIAPIAILTLFSLTGCPSSGPLEEAGEAMDEGIEEAADEVDDAFDDMEDAID